jgi:predicted MFS family arabinose efflux permease
VVFGASTTLLLAALVAMAAAIIAAATFPDLRPRDLPDDDLELGEGERAPTPGLATLLAGAAALILLFSMDEPALVAFVRTSLHAGDAAYGALVSAWGIGLLLGSLAYFRLRGMPSITLVIRSAAVIAIGYLAIGAAPAVGVAALACVLCGIGNGTMQVALITTIQEAVAASQQVKAAAWIESIGAAAAGAGYLAGGLLATVASPRAPFLVGGVAAAAIVAWLLFASVTRSRHRAVG